VQIIVVIEEQFFALWISDQNLLLPGQNLLYLMTGHHFDALFGKLLLGAGNKVLLLHNHIPYVIGQAAGSVGYMLFLPEDLNPSLRGSALCFTGCTHSGCNRADYHYIHSFFPLNSLCCIDLR